MLSDLPLSMSCAGLPAGSHYIKECRTPTCAKQCISCKQIFNQMMFIIFTLRERSQYICHGWQCFDCEQKDREKDWPKAKKQIGPEGVEF